MGNRLIFLYLLYEESDGVGGYIGADGIAPLSRGIRTDANMGVHFQEKRV